MCNKVQKPQITGITCGWGGKLKAGALSELWDLRLALESTAPVSCSKLSG